MMEKAQRRGESPSAFIDVWTGSIAVDHAKLSDWQYMLDDSELQRAQTFKFAELRERFIAVRALLRQTLATYLNKPPQALRFELEAYGKPYLSCGSLHFNLSHSGDFLAIAVADFPQIGIDIEAVAPRNSLDSLAKRVFSAGELAEWRQLPADQQLNVFYRLWTKKEAFVKAVGRGIALGMELCEYELDVNGQIRTIPGEYGRAHDWLVTELSVPAGICGALVTKSGEFAFGRHDFSRL